jgi:UDP-N-acetylmuramate dehydrogenase
VEPSAGSIFRNPPGGYAGKLIEGLGLKGHRIGGAQISPRHANFIVNTGDATAADTLALINLVRQQVWKATGAVLIPEILFLGEWATPPLLPL